MQCLVQSSVTVTLSSFFCAMVSSWGRQFLKTGWSFMWLCDRKHIHTSADVRLSNCTVGVCTRDHDEAEDTQWNLSFIATPLGQTKETEKWP